MEWLNGDRRVSRRRGDRHLLDRLFPGPSRAARGLRGTGCRQRAPCQKQSPDSLQELAGLRGHTLFVRHLSLVSWKAGLSLADCTSNVSVDFSLKRGGMTLRVTTPASGGAFGPTFRCSAAAALISTRCGPL